MMLNPMYVHIYIFSTFTTCVDLRFDYYSLWKFHFFHILKVKIAVERCGCNRASFNRRTSLKGSSAALLLMAVAAVPVIQLGI